MRWDHIFEVAACSLPVAKNSLIVFCPICVLLLTTIHLPHFLCQFPKLKKYHVEIYSTHPHSRHQLPASPWQLPISKDGRACWPCVWRGALRGAGGAHMEQWPSKKKKRKKKHPARLYVPAVPSLISPLPSSALWWRRSAAITASDCCWAHARLLSWQSQTLCAFVKQCFHEWWIPPSLNRWAKPFLTALPWNFADLGWSSRTEIFLPSRLIPVSWSSVMFYRMSVHPWPYMHRSRQIMTFVPHMASNWASNVMEITSMCSK